LLKLHDKGCFIYIVKGSLLEYDICKDYECIEISDDELFDYCQDLDWSDTVKNKWIEAYEKKGVWKDEYWIEKFDDCDIPKKNKQIEIFEKKKDNSFYSKEQKPHLSCLMPKKYANELINYLKFLNMENMDDNIKYIMSSKNFKKTNIDTEIYILTREKSYLDPSKKNLSKWKNYNYFYLNSYYDNNEIINYLKIKPELYKTFYNDYMQLDICASKYGSNINLEEVLLNFF